MFRVCGVTYTFSINYGTCLQSYALKSVIESMEFQGEKTEYKLIPIPKSPGYPAMGRGGVVRKFKRAVEKYTHRKFVGFEENTMSYAPVKEFDRYDEYNDIADAFVCGSDVIWNPIFNRGVTAYYLDFARKYAFSYAASFGQSEAEKCNLEVAGDLIARLREVSVREPRSAEIARTCTQKPVEIVVDPVLLLSREDWDTFAEKENTSGKYIFAYTVNATPLFREFAEKLSKQTKLKVYYAGGNARAVMKERTVRPFTPERWLQMMRDAEYVVTDSFHGTAFATLFHKTSFVTIEGDPAAGFNMRMSNFLKEVGLESRIFKSVPQEIDCTSIDYEGAEQALQKMKQHSFEYLRRNLEAAYAEKQKTEP